jgi:hypothetical protein
MSVTFFLSKHQQCVKYENPGYNPMEPEDPIYNVRYLEEDIYPTLNVSNINAAIFLQHIKLDPKSYTSGEIKNKDLDDFCKKLSLIHSESILNNNSPRLIAYMQQLDKLCRYAIALNDDVVWG